jgi:hypothetical protein
MTTSNNEKYSTLSDEEQRREERMDLHWQQFEEARENFERALMKLEVLEELAER